MRKGYKQEQTSKEGETVVSERCDHVRSNESSYISGYRLVSTLKLSRYFHYHGVICNVIVMT